MAQFYFHVQSDRQLAKDERGRQCSGHSAACAHAIRSMPSLLGKYLQAGANTHVSTQNSNKRLKRDQFGCGGQRKQGTKPAAR
jgi:hypothetical protein